MSDLGNKAVMGKNIQHYMDVNGKTRKGICKDLGFSYSTFTDWINGNSYPRIDKIELMSNYFKIKKSDLVENKDFNNTSTNTKQRKKGVVIDVLGRVAAGVPIEAIEDIVDTEEITEEMATTGEFFGLQIHGDSMEPRMSEGDVVIVRKQQDADSGDTVIAIIIGYDANCKRLKKYKGGIMLLSTNQNYEPMVFSDEDIEKKPVEIIGKVVENRQKY
ncbi:MAG: S24 family peptidase [Lachnospiraceae bacterium]